MVSDVGDAAAAALGAAALEFAVRTRAIDVMDEVAELVCRAVAPLGMTAAASGFVSGPRAASGSPFHFTTWPEAWSAHYLSQDFLLIDPLPRWARNSGVPLTWSDLIKTLSPRDPGRRVVEAGKRFGFTEGMAVPMRSGDNRLGLVTFGGPRDALSLSEQAFLAIVGRAAFEAAERIERDGDIGGAAPILSPREIECVVLLVQGHSDREIGRLLGLSEPTVRFHLGNARDKSGAASRTHLAALTVAQGYVSL